MQKATVRLRCGSDIGIAAFASSLLNNVATGLTTFSALHSRATPPTKLPLEMSLLSNWTLALLLALPSIPPIPITIWTGNYLNTPPMTTPNAPSTSPLLQPHFTHSPRTTAVMFDKPRLNV